MGDNRWGKVGIISRRTLGPTGCQRKDGSRKKESFAVCESVTLSIAGQAVEGFAVESSRWFSTSVYSLGRKHFGRGLVSNEPEAKSELDGLGIGQEISIVLNSE